ncbi:MAG: DegT/DnrJ/EryC1/StrS family aminotransferase [Proteobacteria bacterium]|nr:DegT/DnrJ/EryC1/StrS family aminotransferase [Pseudomonadota bacterium]
MRIEFFRHALDERDIESAVETLRSVFLTTGPACGRFEEGFAAYTGLTHCVSLNSCTAALHLALLALGIGPGDEVITTSMTFIASATSVLHTGATPVLVDVDPDTGLIDPKAVEAAITSRTRAILPVHLYGVMADMRALRVIADKHHLAIVEDAAHCIEASRDGVRPGELGDAACYSFYATKNLTCGEGGAVCTNRADIASQVLLLRQHGMSKEAAKRYHGLYQHWDMVELGWKYNLSDIQAALMVHQLKRLDDLWEQRRAIYDMYAQALADIPSLRLPALRGKSALHLFTVQVPADKRDDLLAYLGQNEIGVAVNYRAIHTLTWFRKHLGCKPEDFPNALAFGQGTLSLPFHTRITGQEIAYVAEMLRTHLTSVF